MGFCQAQEGRPRLWGAEGSRAICRGIWSVTPHLSASARRTNATARILDVIEFPLRPHVRGDGGGCFFWSGIVKSKLNCRRVVEDVCGETVAMDVIDAPARAAGDTSTSASIIHVGDKPTAVVDLSLSTESPDRLRELSRWLAGIADVLGGASPA
jgi:hypothetical protein